MPLWKHMYMTEKGEGNLSEALNFFLVPGCIALQLDSRWHGAIVHFFADTNPLFALIPKPTNQPLHNSYVIIVYRVIRDY